MVQVHKTIIYTKLLMSDISLLADVEGCAAPLSFTGVIALVIISCVLGLLWSAYNILLVNKINVETGYDGESESLVGDIPEEQKKLLIELGEKISNVSHFISLGCYRVLEARIPYLYHLCSYYVHRHLASYC